jgi:DNA ligase D-like protein (predicted 3'-phosphoesterase)
MIYKNLMIIFKIDSIVKIMSKIFVVHEHHARKLHWDLRLEKDGVLESWAIPKQPPLKAGIKRLAVYTEQHELSYANFEGTIPEGMYGAGKVIIWDKGSYEIEEWEENKIVIKINGKKLKGEYVLIKAAKLGKNAWLFFKRKS